MTGTTRDATITPFRIEIPQADLDDLQARLDHARWPDELPDVGWAYGPALVDLKREILQHYRNQSAA